MKKEEYIKNPTGVSALSYWKTCHFKIPSSVKVLREDQFEEHFLEKYSDEVYFKMLHSLDTIGEVVYSDRFQFVKASTEDFAKHINSCYEKESISISELEIYKGRPVYDAELWICLYDTEKDAIVATGIAELDREIQEGYLDWIQVSKEYRGQGLGKVIVYELLQRLKNKASFVTVSGSVENPTKPEKLYENCGFKDKVMWHVLKEK